MKLLNVRPSANSFWTDVKLVGHYAQVELPGWRGLVMLQVGDEDTDDDTCKELAMEMVKDHIAAMEMLGS